MGLADIFEGLRNVAEVATNHGDFLELLEMDRDSACRRIAQIVQGMNQHQLKDLEWRFLQQGAATWGPAHRIRALELYAWFKLQETIHCGGFTGFSGDGGRID